MPHFGVGNEKLTKDIHGITVAKIPDLQLFVDLYKSVLGSVVSISGLVFGKRLLRI